MDSALKLAERVREDVEGHVFDYDGESLKVTVSLGVAFWEGDDSVDSIASFINMADERLYEAKAAGRNRVMPVSA